jgi:hypothetical protein
MPTESEALRKCFDENPGFTAMLRTAYESGKLRSATPEEAAGPLQFICGPNPGGIVGSKQVRCGCGAICWMSPSTQALIAGRTDYTITCMGCFEKKVRREEARGAEL